MESRGNPPFPLLPIYLFFPGHLCTATIAGLQDFGEAVEGLWDAARALAPPSQSRVSSPLPHRRGLFPASYVSVFMRGLPELKSRGRCELPEYNVLQLYTLY